MKKEDLEKKVFFFHDSGFHCAEAVFRAFVEISEERESKDLTKIASAFVQGIGSTHEELCGALAGGIMAIGYVMGRNDPGVDIQSALDAASLLRARFIEKYGSTKCQTLLDKLGPQENGMKCKHLTWEFAGDLYMLLKEKGYMQ